MGLHVYIEPNDQPQSIGFNEMAITINRFGDNLKGNLFVNTLL